MSLHFHRVYNKQNFKHFIKSKSEGAKWDLIASERVKGINQIDDVEDELELVSWMEPAHGDWRLSAEAEWAAGGLVGRRRFGGQVEAQRRAGVAQRRRCWPPRVFRFQRFAPGRLGQHTLASVESDAKGDRNLGSGQVGSVNVQMGRRVWSVGWLVGYFAFRVK